MTDGSDKTPPGRVEVTTKFLAETAARQRAYEAQRRMWTSVFHGSEPRAQPTAMTRRRGKIDDPRQRKFDL
jgi:hypothetical protein